MSEPLLHPAAERLEAYVEGTLADADRAVLESHLLSCPRCQAEVEECRALFAALASLPLFDPSPGFADRVMAGVQVRVPVADRVAAVLGRLLPRTTRGWALAAAFLAAPILVVAALAGWLFTRPFVTPQALWLFLSDRVVDGVGALLGTVGTALLHGQLALWFSQVVRDVVGGHGAQVGAGLALFAVLTVVSIWVLYRNLFRTPTREMQNVALSF